MRADNKGELGRSSIGGGGCDLGKDQGEGRYRLHIRAGAYGFVANHEPVGLAVTLTLVIAVVYGMLDVLVLHVSP